MTKHRVTQASLVISEEVKTLPYTERAALLGVQALCVIVEGGEPADMIAELRETVTALNLWPGESEQATRAARAVLAADAAFATNQANNRARAGRSCDCGATGCVDCDPAFAE